MLKDIRNKEITAGCLVHVSPQILGTLCDGLVYDVSAPMVRMTPQGQMTARQVHILVDFHVILGDGANVPIGLADAADSQYAKDALEILRKALEKLKPGSTGGSLIV